MHSSQHSIGVDVVARLVATQFPKWGDRDVRPVAGAGTVNAIFRIGEDLAARFALQGTDPEGVRQGLLREADAAREFAAASPFASPFPVTMGDPGLGYPLPWSVQSWVPGRVATPHAVADSGTFAGDLVRLVEALRAVPTKGRPFAGVGRGGSLTSHDDWVATCLDRSAGLLDVAAVAGLWQRWRALPGPSRLVMSHTDLIPANLLLTDGRLSGVLDVGGFGPADPALDLVAGWHLLGAGPRVMFREALGGDDIEWERGAAWALEQALGLVWYYRETNPVMASLGRSTVTRLVEAYPDPRAPGVGAGT